MLAFWVIALVVLTYLLWHAKEFFLYHINFSKLPGPPNLSLIVGNVGHLHKSPDEIFKIMRKWGRQYYPLFNIRACHAPACIILNPDDFELVMTNMQHSTKSQVYNILQSWLKTGLLTSGGAKWQTRRKILTPAFHFNILKNFVDIFNEETDWLVNRLKTESRNKSEITINSHITQFTLKSLAETAMGTKLSFETSAEKDYKNAILEIGKIYCYRLLRPWLCMPIFYNFTSLFRKEQKLVKTLHDFTTDVIEKRQKDFVPFATAQANTENNTKVSADDDAVFTKKRMAMLDLLLSVKMNDGSIDDEGIREEVDTFMFEGHDTTSVAISFGLMTLACNPEAQTKILEEMSEILGDVHKKPTYQDLQEMKYLDRCIKEILRLYPSVPFISRILGNEIVTSTGHKLSKDSMVHLLIYDLHHNPDIYPDPEKFDPDRFLPEITKDRHPFAYLPFSAGPRNCIGQRFATLELKAVFCGILANFVLEPVDTPDTIVFVADLILRTTNGIRVRFIPRSQ